MKVVLSNGVEFPVTQASVRYAETKEGKDAEDIKYPIVDFVAEDDSLDVNTLIQNKEHFDEFDLQYGGKTKKFTGFQLYEESLRENYTDYNSSILFFATSI